MDFVNNVGEGRHHLVLKLQRTNFKRLYSKQKQKERDKEDGCSNTYNKDSHSKGTHLNEQKMGHKPIQHPLTEA